MGDEEDLERLRQLALERLEDGPERRALLSRPLDDMSDLPQELLSHNDSETISDSKTLRLADLTMAQKIKLAMFGNKAARTLLLRDPNRMIQLFVLDNPRLSENEVAELAKNSQVDEAVLRQLATNTTWMRTYSMKLTICQNPKVPIDVGLKWIKFLTDKDLVTLARSKMVPQVISTQCRKLADKREAKKKTGGKD